MNKESLTALGMAILISLVLIFSGSLIKIIPAGHAGVVFNLFGGVEKRVLNEGVNFVIPFVEAVTTYDARKISYTFSDNLERSSVGQSIKCQTNDGQQIDIDLTVIAHLDKNKTWKIHQDLGRDYAQKLIVPQSRSIIRNIVAKYPIDTVYTSSRAGLAKDVEHALRKSFLKSGLYLDELLIRGITFSPAFAEAVERKQIALQESQRQNWIKKTAEREKERKIIEGEGDARALSVKGQALSLDPRIAELEFLEQIEQRETEIPIITGAMNVILSIGELLNEPLRTLPNNTKE
ncbi:MAG: prohibitin family protein [Candidatus Melainabacteria bacterium]|nr:prohibitin family protein [Candidatus Melainabacteria bacterium]